MMHRRFSIPGWSDLIISGMGFAQFTRSGKNWNRYDVRRVSLCGDCTVEIVAMYCRIHSSLLALRSH